MSNSNNNYCKKDSKIIFMGTPQFAATSLKYLIDKGYNIVAVVTQPDRQKNRGKKISFSPVKELALEYNIPVLQPEKVKANQLFLDELRHFQPDVAVVAAYGKILPKEILELPRCGCINVHGSILPQLRGASPIQCAILEGMTQTGVTIMKMDEGMDTGNMISKVYVPVLNSDFEELHDKLADAGGQLLVETIDSILDGTANEEVQNESEATYSFMISKEDGHLSFQNDEAKVLERKVRAFSIWPGTYFYHNSQMVKVKEAAVCSTSELNSKDVESSDAQEAGSILALTKDGIIVKCKEDALLIKKVQPAGKKTMDAWSFLMGNKMEVGDVLR